MYLKLNQLKIPYYSLKYDVIYLSTTDNYYYIFNIILYIYLRLGQLKVPILL